MRVAVAFDNLGPYHIARIRGASAHMDVVAIEVAAKSAQYAWDRSDLPDGVTHVVLMDSSEDKTSSPRLQSLIERKVEPLGLDAIAVPGWSSLASLRLTDWATRRGIPVIVMTETNGWDFRRRPAAEYIKRGIVAHYSAGLGTSVSHADYLALLGLPRSAVFYGYNAVDNDYFARMSQAVRVGEVFPSRVASLLPEESRGRFFLASNRFIEKKNLSRLLKAYAAFRAARAADPSDWPLVLLGEGELRAALESEIAALGLELHVHMPGFCQYGELPEFYGSAGAFVHASTTEQWGLVVNEAMASGLPVAVSQRCGCAEVLVRDGANGVIFDPYDERSITTALERIAGARDRARMGELSRTIIADWGPARFGAGMAAAAQRALHAKPRRLRLTDRLSLRVAERWLGP